MDTEMNIGLEQAVGEAAATWPSVGEGDPNTIDLYWHACRVQERLQLELPETLPTKERGVCLVELVEKHFVGGLIRFFPPDVLVKRALTLVAATEQLVLIEGGRHQSYVCSLYAWHGCVNMAKLLRHTFVTADGEAEYTMERRVEGYASLQQFWSKKEARGNRWVSYGVSLARGFEMNRKKENFTQMVVEDWVPPNSPYWGR